jgi:hypothetical protein
LLGIGESLVGRLLLYDALALDFRLLKLTASCSLFCSNGSGQSRDIAAALSSRLREEDSRLSYCQRALKLLFRGIPACETISLPPEKLPFGPCGGFRGVAWGDCAGSKTLSLGLTLVRWNIRTRFRRVMGIRKLLTSLLMRFDRSADTLVNPRA